MKIISLGATIGTAVVVGGMLAYIKYMKKKVRKYVLRNNEIKKYYKK
jgi:hypothetical protein